MMGKDYTRFSTRFLVAVLIMLTWSMGLWAQTYNDGPIQLQARLHQFNIAFPETDLGVFGIVGQPDDLTYNVWVRDAADLDNVINPSWGAGSGCLTENYVLPLTNWNLVLFNYTYPSSSVPQFLDIRVDLWEDESPDQLLGIGCGGTRCAYDVNFCCGGFLFGLCLGQYDDDDLRCNSGAATPYAQLNYRLGPPCQWYNHGFVPGNCTNNVYNPRFETFWRYTRGETCGPSNAINLGSLNNGFSTITHFNSNECYTDDIVYPGGGRDVVYMFTVSQPIGLTINTCGPGSLTSDVLVLNNACNIIFQNSGGCGSGSQIAQPFCTPGTYYIVVEGRNNGQGTFTLTVQENPTVVVSANAGPNVAVCTGLGVTIGAQLPVTPATGGQPGYTYNWVPNSFIGNPNDSITSAFPPTTTQYILEVTDALGCIDRDTTIVTVNPGPVVSLGPNQTICPNTNVILDAGPGFTSYFWNTGDFTQTVNADQPGSYIAVASDINGCLGRDTVQILNYPAPSVNLGRDTAICIGTNLLLDAGPGYVGYNWNTSAGTQTINASTSGTYHVTVTDANGCQEQDTVNVGINPLPTPSLPAVTTICPGDNAILNPGAGYLNYAWSNGTINQILITSNIGTATVTVTDANGCENTATTNITNFNSPAGFNVTAPSNFVCQGQSVTLDAGASAAIAGYLWNTGANTQTISVNSPGWYKCSVTDIGGCVWVDSMQINVLPNPAVNLGPDTTLCAGNNLVLLAPAGLTYNWSTGSTAQNIIVSTSGTYSVTVTNLATTCTATDQVAVVVSPQPTPTLPAAASFCANTSLTLDPGSGYAQYAWSTGANSQSIVVNTAGTYTVTVTNLDGCTATATSVVTQAAPLNVIVGGGGSACDGSTIFLVASPGFTAYDWSNGFTGSSLAVTSSGTYTVTVTDAGGCTGTATGTVNFFPNPSVSLGPNDTLCAGNTATLNAGAGFSGYSWNTGANTQSVTVAQTGTYTVTVTDANGCSASSSVDLIGSTVPAVDLGPASLNICDSGSVIIDAGPQYIAYNWSPNPSPNQYILVSQAGNYAVTVTDQYGCQSNDNINVTVNAVTPANFMVHDTVGCAGVGFLLDAGDQFIDYTWNTGSPDQYLLVNTSGTYQVTVTDPNGCRFTDTTHVTLQVPPTVELGPSPNLCPGETDTLNAGAGFDSYIWSTGSTDPSIIVDQAGIYSVTVTFGVCTLNDNISVGNDCPGKIFIPNVFTPNGDGNNDEFWIYSVNLESLDIAIYDRWGKFMYQSNNKDFRWDGKYKGNELPEGVYYYHTHYKLNADENLYEDKGTVTILR
jgi:gliding motility-associated-like protein